MLGLVIDRKSPITLSRQISGQIGGLILESRLAAGDILPSTRELAGHLRVSRNTVTEAYEMLWAGGYLSSRQGSRFKVAERIRLAPPMPPASERKPASRTPAKRIRHDFRTGLPDVSLFPFAKWNSLQRNVLETLRPSDLLYGETQGHQPLRAAIARWLLRSRGMKVEADGIFITSGATHAIALSLEVLAAGGRPFAIEDPCHLGIIRLLRLKNLSFESVAVDSQGMRTEELRRRALAGVYLTPSHQFPLGWVMSAARRAHLVELARKRDFYLIEDDYDSEYRFGGPPLAPLHSLDAERVFYVGTFSKTLFPALRVGYAVVPERLRESWLTVRRYTDVQNSIQEQAVLGEFLERRMMDRHMKRMTGSYARKRASLVRAVIREFGDGAIALGDAAGLHMAVRFPGREFDRRFKEHCRERDLLLMPCGRYAARAREFDDTLLLGYGIIAEKDIAPGIRRMRALMSLP